MNRNGRCAIDAVPRDGFPTQTWPVEYHDPDRRYVTPYYRQCTRHDSGGVENSTKRYNRWRYPAHFGIAGRDSEHPQRHNFSSSLGPADGLLTDVEASRRVERCFKRRQNHVSGRILRKLLNRELELGQQSLDDIHAAADSVFFDGSLCGRVKWRWSRAGEEGYENELLGSTTPQYSPETGIEARIVLSRPILQSGRYSRDLLLSTFLHELVHCYLFVCCGDAAQKDGGHTPGFQQIVQLINGWIGNSRLRLCSMKADLDHFAIDSADVSRSLVAVDSVYHSPHPSQYMDFGDCTFVCGFNQHTLSLDNGDPPPTFERIGRNVARPPLAYVSMQERVMQALGGSVSMPIIVE